MGGDAFVEEIENAATLLGAGGDDAPHTLVVTLADVVTSALRDSGDDAVTNLLLADGCYVSTHGQDVAIQLLGDFALIVA